MKKLIADKVLSHDLYQAWPGNEFECPDGHVAALIKAKAAHLAPKKVERAVDSSVFEKAVDEPEVLERVTKASAKPKTRKRVSKGGKVSGRK